MIGINGQSVMFDKYADIISKLQNWTPPLVLGFRQAPEKDGELKLKAENKNSFRKKFFSLAEGKLIYRTKLASNVVQGELSLTGNNLSHSSIR